MAAVCWGQLSTTHPWDTPQTTDHSHAFGRGWNTFCCTQCTYVFHPSLHAHTLWPAGYCWVKLLRSASRSVPPSTKSSQFTVTFNDEVEAGRASSSRGTATVIHATEPAWRVFPVNLHTPVLMTVHTNTTQPRT